jgi:hypothetical protein
LGVPDGEKMIAYTFAVVASTIVLHGFSLPILAKTLDLKSSSKPGILIVGGSPWTTAFAEKLQSLEIPLLIADSNWNHLRGARSKNLPTFYGDVLSEHAHHEINMGVWATVITMTDNDAYNALVCTEFGPEIGRGNVFQIGSRGGENAKRELYFTRGGRPLFKPAMEFTELQSNLREGWVFSSTALTKEMNFEKFKAARPENSVILFWFKPGGAFVFPATNPNSTPGDGSIIISFGLKPAKPKEDKEINTVDQDK